MGGFFDPSARSLFYVRLISDFNQEHASNKPARENFGKVKPQRECETSPEPRGSLYGAQQNRLQIAKRQSNLLA